MLVVTATAACVFTDPINVAPRIEEILAPPSLFRGDLAEFRARTTDDQQEPPVLTWAHHPGACPAELDRASWPVQREPGERHRVPQSDTTGRFCVWAFATDSHGAVDVENLELNPANHVPVAQIEVVSPQPATNYQLYSLFRLSSGDSVDPDQDPLTMQWELVQQPAGSQAKLAPCENAPPPQNPLQCFEADVAGQYQVKLSVSDGFDGRAEDVATFVVLPDRLPCVGQTQPDWLSPTIVHAPNLSDKLTVLVVSDDGNPLPGGRHGIAHFRWGTARGDEKMVYVARDLPWLDIPQGMFGTGDSVRVRVEIYDDPNASAIDAALAGCKDDDLCAAQAGSQCFQRVTWKIEYR